ncbi:ATP-dependent RNA helicase, DEAD/DEAH box family [Phenylobacterium zucineum HLK1]|uniref:DEAD-box ATP-dependent RNA helicase RhpA n=1 Tax=Phenylobacterium zucineum (strain HLK1) TaxID=450851 RepID=B4RBS5_PHEZH|nr:DEAD/DEAH box helicase [Phenylobacterium zucineum]ACG78122.1 ATP-dependent RNA helicase, DEAD/DEAH box family [Phenylobacterium zucineum HLK1]
MTEFSDLGLSPATLKAVAETGYTTATPIQAEAIPMALQGRDVLGIAQTGTGKTAAFTLPMIDRLAAGRAKARMPRALVIAPTRELADQVSASFEKYAMGQKLTWALLIGGVSFKDQEQKLDRGVDVLIATPGRLLDHFERGKLLMTGVQIMVVDEADRMLDMGFIPDLERIFKLTPAKKQTLFFSATMPPEITRLTKQFLNDPVRIEASRPATTAETITQYLVRIPSADPKAKRTALRELIGRAEINNGIVFCNRKTEVDIVAKSLKKHGFDAAAIHGDLDQATRMRTLESFRNGELKLLCASDVAARGLDIPAVSHVFNFDVPHHADDYVHRIGRTGRAGRTGEAFMIVTPADSKNLDKVLKLIGKTPEEVSLDLDWANIKDEPRPGRGRERGGRERKRKPREAREPRPRREKAEAAPAPAAEPAAQPQPAPRPARERPAEESRPARAERPARERPERERSERERPQRERPERERAEAQDRRRGRDDGDRVVGFGSDVPAFLQRPPPRSTKD